MSFEEELEEIDRQEWLSLFDDKLIMHITRVFLDWLYDLPDDYVPTQQIKFFKQFYEHATRTTTKATKSIAATEKRNRYADNRKEDGIRKVLSGKYYYEQFQY